MRFSALARKSLADVQRRKARSALAILGIAVGVAGLCSINLSSRAIVGAQAFLADSHHDPDVSINTAGTDPVLLGKLQALPGVKAAELASVFQGLWWINAAPGRVNLKIAAYPNLSAVAISPFQLTSGSLPTAPGQIALDSTDRDYQGFALGDTINVQGSAGMVPLSVVGTVRVMGQGAASLVGTARGYMTTGALAAISSVNKPNLALLQVDDPSKAAATAQAATAVLRKGGSTVVSTSLGSGGVGSNEIKGLYTIMDVLSMAALLLAALLIANTIGTLVTEQQPSMGVMKALGGTQRAVARGYVLTVCLYALSGTAIGLVVGIFGGAWLTTVLSNAIVLDTGPFHLNFGVLALGAGLGLAVPLLAALGPIWWGTQATVREALTGHLHGSGSSAGLPRWISGLPGLPRTLWLGLAGTFRRPVRAVLTLAALACAASTFLAIQTASYSFNRYQQKLSAQFQADVYVQSAQPRPVAQLSKDLAGIGNVAHTEAFEERTVTSPWGPVILEGAQPDPALYRLRVLEGTWLKPGMVNSLLINPQLAARSGLHVGDLIALSTPTNAQYWTIVGIAQDYNTGLGTAGVAVTTLDSLNAFAGIPGGLTTGMMVATTDHSDAAVSLTAVNAEAAMLKDGLTASVRTAAENLARNRRQFGILSLLLESVAAIVGLIGILGLSSTLTTSVLERRREMGTLRAMGASNRRVAGVFVTEGLTLAIMATILATAAGLPLAYAFVHLIDRSLVDFGFAFNPATLGTMAGLTVVVALGASIGPAMGASQIRIADCLRYE